MSTVASKPNSNSQIVEIHEERIGRLEENVQECVVKNVEQNAKIELLANKLEDGISRVVEKVDLYITTLSNKLLEHIDGDRELAKQIMEKLESNNSRTHKLEVKEVVRTERNRLLRKYVWPLGLACGGILATKLGEMLWAWITNK